VAARDGLAVGHGQRQPDGSGPGTRADRLDGLVVRGDENVVGPPAKIGVALPGREDAVEVAHGCYDVRLAQGAGAGDHVAQVGRGALAEAGEAVRRRWLGPAAACGNPSGCREVVERDDRLEVVLLAGGAHAPVVLERGTREL